MKFEKPKFKRYVFAQEAANTTIEDVPDVQTTEKEKEGYCGYQHGFTNINMTAIEQGGKPPRGTQFNQILKDITGVTQYLSAGGLYPMNNEIIQSEGYPKNAIICVDEVGLFRSLMDDNKTSDYKNASAWSMVVDFNPVRKIQRVVGEIFPALRIDTPEGCLRCDGSEHQVSQYQYFVEKYLKTGKVPSVTIEAWNQQHNSQDYNCGYFGYDKDGNTFKVPCIQTGTFLTSGTSEEVGNFGWDTTFKTPDSSFGLCGMHFLQTEFYGQKKLEVNDFPYLDQWVDGQFKQIPCPIQQGVMYNRVNLFNLSPLGSLLLAIYGGRKIVFNPTEGLRTSDKVQPRNIQYPFFVVISEIFKEDTGEV